MRCVGINSALRRVLTRSVLACGLSAVIAPPTRELCLTAEPLLRIPLDRLSRKRPVQERQGHRVAPVQVADKAEGRVSAAGRGLRTACRSIFSFARTRCHNMGRHCPPQ